MITEQEKKEYKVFFKNIGLFLLPFFIISLVELTLPVNYFATRFWESVNVYNRIGRILLPGPFYPNVRMTMDEMCDIGVHTRYGVPKKATWETNQYGFRTKESGEDKYDILVIGDSLSVGSGVSQEATISEVLARETGLKVYGLGGYFPNDLVRSGLLEKHTPKFVIDVQMERYINDTSKFEITDQYDPIIFLHDIAQHVIQSYGLEKLNPLFVFIDRFLKGNIYRTTYSNIRYFLEPKEVKAYGNPPILFYNYANPNAEVSKETFDATVEKIVEMDTYMKSKGITFIVFVVPNKETIYFNLLPDNKKPTFLPELTSALSAQGVITFNTQDAFLLLKERYKKVIYSPCDTHWNEGGIEEAVKLLVPVIKNKNY